MKGLKIVRALPSNGLDIYALLKQAMEEKIFPDSPTSKQLEEYYLTKLISYELTSPMNFWYVAKRGRGFLGCLHAVIMPRRWDSGPPDQMFLELVYVTEPRRKMGIGKKLIDELIKDAENMGIKKIDLLAYDKVFDGYWAKKRDSKKVANLGRIEL